MYPQFKKGNRKTNDDFDIPEPGRPKPRGRVGLTSNQKTVGNLESSHYFLQYLKCKNLSRILKFIVPLDTLRENKTTRVISLSDTPPSLDISA